MHKTVRNLLIAIAAMLGVSACNFDMVDTYTFYDKVSIRTKEEDKANQIEGYFREVIDFDTNKTFHGRQFDAITYGQSIVEQYKVLLDAETIQNFLVEDEAVQYSMWMSGKKTKMVIAQILWTAKGEESGEQGNGSTTTPSAQVVE